MINDGADFIDIGGESTRPGSDVVLPADEAIRVLPIIQKLSSKKLKLSLDTRNSSTMELGLLVCQYYKRCKCFKKRPKKCGDYKKI